MRHTTSCLGVTVCIARQVVLRWCQWIPQLFRVALKEHAWQCLSITIDSCSSGRIGSEMSVFTVCRHHESDNSKAIGTTDCIDDVCTQTQSNFLRTGAPQLNTESTLPILIKSARFKCEIWSNSCQFVQKDFQRSFREDSCWKGVHQKLTTLRK